jgi:predicted nucleic acid-binding protein
VILPDANLLLYAYDSASPFHAQLASLALRYRAVVHTADSDFARFADVRWYNPLATSN